MNKDHRVFGDVLAAAMIGSWKIEVDEGKEPRMYADAAMLHLIGLPEDSTLSPEEVYRAWYDRIDPAHYDAVAEGVGYMLNDQLAEIQYPWHHPDGRTIIVRCGGIRDKSYTAGNRAVGIHQWVTTMKHVERELEAQQRQLKDALESSEIASRHEKLKAEALGFIVKNDNIEAFIDFFSAQVLDLYGCDQMFYRDVEGRTILKSKPGTPLMDFSLCHDCPYYAFEAPVYADGSAVMDDRQVGCKGIHIHPDCRVKASLTYLVYEGNKVFGYIALHYLNQTHYFSNYEKETFDSIAKFMSMVLSRRRQNKRNMVLAALSNQYISVFDVDLKTGLYEIVKHPDTTKVMDRKDRRWDLALGHDFAAECLDETRKTIEKIGSVDFIRQELKDADHREYLYSHQREVGGTVYRRCTTLALERDQDGNATRALVNFMSVDNNQAKILEQQELISSQQLLMDGLAREYHTVWTIDGRTHDLSLFRTTGVTTAPGTVEYGTKRPNYDHSIIWYVDNFVDETDRERVRKAVSWEEVEKNTPEIGIYAVTYKRHPVPEKTDYHQMCFARAVGANGEHNFVFAYRDVDAMVREQLKTEERQRRAIEESLVFSNYFIDTFVSTYSVNLDTHACKVYSRTEDLMSQSPVIDDYFEAMKAYAAKDVHPDDRKALLEFISPENLKKLFAENRLASFSFRDISEEEEKSYSIRVVRGADEKTAAIAFADITNETRKELEQQKRLEEALATEKANAQNEKAYQLAILNKAYSYFRINLSHNRIMPPIIEREHGQPVDYTSKFPHPLPAYEDVIALGAKRYVDEDYKESYRAYNNCAYLIKCFHEGNMMPEYVCHIYSTTIGWHYRKYVTYLSQDEISGDIYGMSVAYDITQEHEAAEQEKKYKRELEEAYRKLENALSLAQSASKAKTEFLFNMSHDIRTPMNAIRGFTDIAKKNLDDHERLSDCLNKIDNAGELLLSLINSVLDMSRVESGKAKLEELPGNVLESFTNIKTTMQVLANAKGISLSFSFGAINDKYVYGDFGRCNRVFVNIISNAIKYSKPNGYVKVRCEQAEPSVNGRAWYRYTVEDNGIGMSEEFLHHLFEEFSREHNSTTSGIQGTGLGLALCKTFVELMGGTITCQSKQGIGTTFTVTLPFRTRDVNDEADSSAEVPHDAETAEGKIAEAYDFTGKRILLVEDNELNREVAEFLLNDNGFEIEAVEDGSIAVNRVREKGNDYYDYILMDIQMPIMGGYEATKIIRAEGFTRPIIALSANAFEEDRSASIAAGMNAHVAKPINIKVLLETLRGMEKQ